MPKIENATITSIKFGYEDHDILTLQLMLKGDHWECGFGGYALDTYVKRKKKRVPTQVGFEAITELMNTLGVTDLYDLKGKYVRIEWEGNGIGACRIAKIGHLMEDRWFSFKEFFESRIK